MTGTTVKPLVLQELTFEEEPHIYRLNGVAIPSVSKLMEPLRNLSYSRVDRKTLEKAAAKGTTVHNSIENWIKFGIDDVPMEHRGYFNGFLEWEDKFKPEVIASEMRVYHKLLEYGGTIDCLCIINGELSLVDFKTTYHRQICTLFRRVIQSCKIGDAGMTRHSPDARTGP